MIRWMLGFFSLFLTLLAGGCTPLRQARVENPIASPPSPNVAAPQHDVKKNTSDLPDMLPPTSDALPAAPKSADAGSSEKKYEQFTIEPKRPPVPQAIEPKITVSPPVTPPTPFDTSPKHPVVLALDCLLDNRPQEAQQHLRCYDLRTEEFLMRMLPLLSHVARNNNLNSADIAALLEQTKSINECLQKYSDFALPKMCFCESIKEYAIYKPLPPDHEFVAAQPDRPGEFVQLYVELINFASKQSKGLFETKFASHIEIRDDKGKVCYSHDFPREKTKLVSRSRLGEFYQAFQIPLPASLPPGSYTLIVVITDETLTNSPPRTARASLPLRITASKD